MYMCRKVNRALNGKKRVAMSLSGSMDEGIADGEVEEGTEKERGDKNKRSREGGVSSTNDTSTSGSSTFNHESGNGCIIRGMDDDEIEGEDGDEKNQIDGQDDDLFFGEESDGEDYESEEDGEGGYDSLGEEEIFLEDRDRRLREAAVIAESAALQDTDVDSSDGAVSMEKIRNRMLREVLGLPEG